MNLAKIAVMASLPLMGIAQGFAAPARIEYKNDMIYPHPEVVTAEVTAYTSSEDETDDTPDVMASGKHVYEGAIACPRAYSFGTKIYVEGREYVCEDRMAMKYDDRFDILVGSKAEAQVWGVRLLQIEIER